MAILESCRFPLYQKKQVRTSEELIAQKVAAFIVQPVTSTSADASMQRPLAQGIPVILAHRTAIESDALHHRNSGWRRSIFGKVMGDFFLPQNLA